MGYDLIRKQYGKNLGPINVIFDENVNALKPAKFVRSLGLRHDLWIQLSSSTKMLTLFWYIFSWILSHT